MTRSSRSAGLLRTRVGYSLAVLIGISGVAIAQDRWSPTDRRLLVSDDAVSVDLRLATASVAFIDVTLSKSMPQSGTERPLAQDGGTGVLLSPCLVLTAGHVAGAEQSNADFKVALSVLFPTLDGSAAEPVAATVVARGGVTLRRGALLDDWALLRLAKPVKRAVATITLTECCGWSSLPMSAAVAGYPVDRLDRSNLRIWVDPGCQITRQLPIAMLATNCQATSGNSGGPLFIKSEKGWQVAGIITRAPAPTATGIRPGAVSYAIPFARRLRQIITQEAQKPCPA